LIRILIVYWTLYGRGFCYSWS